MFLASPLGGITDGLHLRTLDLKHFCDKNRIIFFCDKTFQNVFSLAFSRVSSLKPSLFHLFFFLQCVTLPLLSWDSKPPCIQTRTHSASLRIARFQCKGEMNFLPIFFFFFAFIKTNFSSTARLQNSETFRKKLRWGLLLPSFSVSMRVTSSYSVRFLS